MMKNMKYILILFLLVPFSCIEDESRYGDIEIDEIKIEGIDKMKEIEVGAKLEVNPVITTKFGDESQLSYVWYKYNRQQTVADTLSYEKNLSVVIADVLPGVVTTLAFKVIDQQTGVFAFKTSSFVTTGKYSGGTLMLCQTNGENELAMLKKDGTTLYENIYALANNGEKPGMKSKRIILTDSDVWNPLNYKSVIITCNDETGGVYLDPNILKRQDYMKDKFVFSEDMKGDLDIVSCTEDQSSDYLVVNGKVYNRPNGSGSKAGWNPEVVFLTEPKEYSAAAFSSHPTGYPFYGRPVFYDNLNGRFMFNANGGYFSFFSGTGHDFTKFDPNAMGEGVILMASGSVNSALDKVWALMKDTNKEEYFIITYKFVYNADWTYSFVSESKSTISKGACPGLYNASDFIPGTKVKIDNYVPWDMLAPGISDVFFYVNNNKVYAFNVKTLSEGVIVDGTAENYTITGVDCTEIPAPTESNPNASFVQITVPVKDGRLSSKQGGIATYRLNSIGGLSAQKMYAKTGFCDEVLYTVEKLD